MRFVDEFRDPEAAKKLLGIIESRAEQLDRPVSFMEVCGGHTHTIYRHGLEHLLPQSVKLIHGPGCPVCVIPMGRLDDAVWLAKQKDVIFTTFGDMMRVPGTEGSLLQAQSQGADVRFVYSPLDSLKIAIDNPDKEVVFFAVGFETTSPSTAVTLVRAEAMGIKNFSVFSNHVLIEPPLRAILDSDEIALDGFIGPGHVATVVGSEAFDFLPRDFSKSVVVTGFEPLDILQSVEMLLRQHQEGRTQVENQYARVVRPEGNTAAQELLGRVFRVRPSFEWRGLGWIENSGLGLSEEFQAFDAETRFALPGRRIEDPPACECGAVLRGLIRPWQCRVFGTACTPETPIGTCMVSPEGACAAYYNYGRMHRDAAELIGQQ